MDWILILVLVVCAAMCIFGMKMGKKGRNKTDQTEHPPEKKKIQRKK
ncbi:hypothetical protein [Legionella pneumophila]|nr:hypothetical protein [Legionella pneumophila]HAT1860708.1 hypothetical protein [Legionella pneumophila]